MKWGIRKQKRVVIVHGTNDARTLYNIIGTIRMLQGSEKIDYFLADNGTLVHMIGYRATDEQQESIAKILGRYNPELRFGYLNRK